jgi:hypothetical protein
MRQQQAQLTKLEDELLRGPRPIPGGPLGSMESPSTSTLTSPINHYDHQYEHQRSLSGSSANGHKLTRRASRDVLEELAGPDSSLPLPMQNNRFNSSTSSLQNDGIREGRPMEFGASTASLSSKRTPSPTRTLSRQSLIETW